jgi:hypothetical protein
MLRALHHPPDRRPPRATLAGERGIALEVGEEIVSRLAREGPDEEAAEASRPADDRKGAQGHHRRMRSDDASVVALIAPDGGIALVTYRPRATGDGQHERRDRRGPSCATQRCAAVARVARLRVRAAGSGLRRLRPVAAAGGRVRGRHGLALSRRNRVGSCVQAATNGSRICWRTGLEGTLGHARSVRKPVSRSSGREYARRGKWGSAHSERGITGAHQRPGEYNALFPQGIGASAKLTRWTTLP